MNDIVTLISTVGFPIAACVAMGFYVKYQMDHYEKQIDEIIKEHKEEMKEVTTAINNNTVALTKLCDKLEGKA